MNRKISILVLSLTFLFGIILSNLEQTIQTFAYIETLFSWIFNSEFLYYFIISIIFYDYFKSIIKLLILRLSTKNSTNNIKYNQNSLSNKQKFSILIPAYHADRIKETIQSVIDSSYKNKEIIVIVNGNDKTTLEKAAYLEKKYPELVKVLFLEKKGKALALNHGLKWAKGDFVITLDADAKIINKKSIDNILKRFESDKQVIAMSADIQISPGDNCTKNIWTKFQALEYLINMHVGKRFQTIFNTMLIIPGGFGVFKREYLKDKTPFNEQSLTEDFVISLDIHAYGKKVVFEPNAIARFDCPDNFTKLKAQRTRWSCGQINTLKSFKHFFFLPGYNRLLKLAILDMWTFDVFFNAIWITTFLVVLPSILIFSGLDLITEQIEIENNPLHVIPKILEKPGMVFGEIKTALLPMVLIGFYFIIESISVLSAIRISNRKECYNLLWYLPLFVFIYRPILRLLIIRGHIKGIRGKTISWNGKEETIPFQVAPKL